jgi:hypothetical protein
MRSADGQPTVNVVVMTLTFPIQSVDVKVALCCPRLVDQL